MKIKPWTKKELTLLYDCRLSNAETYKQISQKLPGRSAGSIERKYKRVDWGAFNANPDNHGEEQNGSKKWSQQELYQLDAYLQASKSYGFIAQKLNRSPTSVERKAQQTDWQAWRSAMI